MDPANLLDPRILLGSFVYAVVGIIIFAAAFYLCDKLTPGDMWREIIEKQNMAVAILAGCAGLGICLIIAAAIH